MTERLRHNNAGLPPNVAACTCQFFVGETLLEIIPQSAQPTTDACASVYATFQVSGQCYEVRKCAEQPEANSPLLNLLTKRERDIVYRIGAGLRNKQIAFELHLSEYTVAAYVKQICYKLQVRNRAAMITRCMQLQASGEDGQSPSATPHSLQQVMEGAFKPTNSASR